jgi:hypothetical protein
LDCHRCVLTIFHGNRGIDNLAADKIAGKHESIARKLTESFHKTFNEFLAEARELTKN